MQRFSLADTDFCSGVILHVDYNAEFCIIMQIYANLHTGLLYLYIFEGFFESFNTDFYADLFQGKLAHANADFHLCVQNSALFGIIKYLANTIKICTQQNRSWNCNESVGSDV